MVGPALLATALSLSDKCINVNVNLKPLAYFFLAKLLKLHQVGWETFMDGHFKSICRCSIGLRSGL